MADALHVQGLVDVLKEAKTDNAIVSTFVFYECVVAEYRVSAICGVYTGRVEDFVDTGRCQSCEGYLSVLANLQWRIVTGAESTTLDEQPGL